jgi:hypothetical protein
MKVYAYINPELNILCCALLKEAVPPGINAIEFDVDKPDDVIYDGKNIRLKNQNEQLQELKQKYLDQLKKYVNGLFSSTDYIVVKISEAIVNEDNEEVSNLKQQYATQLQQRKAIRDWNNKIKEQINNASSIEELNTIVIQYQGI